MPAEAAAPPTAERTESLADEAAEPADFSSCWILSFSWTPEERAQRESARRDGRKRRGQAKRELFSFSFRNQGVKERSVPGRQES
jgi:hypothetical protein